jgi:hypothetical protein
VFNINLADGKMTRVTEDFNRSPQMRMAARCRHNVDVAPIEVANINMTTGEPE